MREYDLQLGEVDGDIVHVHRVRELEPDAAAAGKAGTDSRMPRVEERGHTRLSDDLVQRVESAIVGIERLHVRVELEPLDVVVANEPLRLLYRPGALVRIDRGERDEHVRIRRRDLGDLLVRNCRAPGHRLRVDGEDDRGELALAVVGRDVLRGRQRVLAEVPGSGRAPLRPHAVLTRAADLRVDVDVDRLDGRDVDRHDVMPVICPPFTVST